MKTTKKESANLDEEDKSQLNDFNIDSGSYKIGRPDDEADV